MNGNIYMIFFIRLLQGQEESEVDRALKKAVEEEAEEQRRQCGEDVGKIHRDSGDNVTFDMFATDSELPTEVFLCVFEFLAHIFYFKIFYFELL